MTKYVLALIVALLCACKTSVTPEQQVNDAEVTAQVKARPASDLGLTTITNFAVNSTNGVVTLSGRVDNAKRKTKAEQIAAGVPKVTRMINKLQAQRTAAVLTDFRII